MDDGQGSEVRGKKAIRWEGRRPRRPQTSRSFRSRNSWFQWFQVFGGFQVHEL